MPARAFDLNVCTYVDAATVSRITGAPARLDTSTGDTGFNAHLRSGPVEQCLFVPEGATTSGPNIAVVQVNLMGAQHGYEEAHAGDISTGTQCPLACADLGGLGDAAFVSASFGVGGDSGGGSAFVMSRLGEASVLVGVTSRNPTGRRPTKASELDPASVAAATELNLAVLARLTGAGK